MCTCRWRNRQLSQSVSPGARVCKPSYPSVLPFESATAPTARTTQKSRIGAACPAVVTNAEQHPTLQHAFTTPRTSADAPGAALQRRSAASSCAGLSDGDETAAQRMRRQCPRMVQTYTFPACIRRSGLAGCSQQTASSWQHAMTEKGTTDKSARCCKFTLLRL